MKKNLFYLNSVIISLVFIVSCASKLSQDETVRKNLEIKLNENIDNFKNINLDINNYEILSLKLSDSITHKNNYEKHKWLVDYDETAYYALAESLARDPLQENNESKRKNMIESKIIFEKRFKRYEFVKDSLVKLNQFNDATAYRYSYRLKGKDNQGKEVLKYFIAVTGPSPEFEIIDMPLEFNEENPTPNSLFK